MTRFFYSLLPSLLACALVLPSSRAADVNVEVRVDDQESATVKEASEAVKEAVDDVASTAREARRAARQAKREAAEAARAARGEIEAREWEAEAPQNEDRMQEVVLFGKRGYIATNQYAPTVVVFFENARIDGRAGEVVVIGGNAEINGRVREQVVSVLGRVKLGTNAWVGNQVVGIGGGVDRADTAHVGHQVVSIPLPGFEDLNFELPAAVRNAFAQLVVKARLLSFKVGWVWPIYGAFFLMHLLLAAVFPKAMDRTASILEQRPAGSVLMGLAAIPLGFIVALLVAATGIGVLTWPFLFAAFVIAGLFGKAALTRHIGISLGRQFGAGAVPGLLALVFGSLLFAALYLVPFLGLMVWMVGTMWGLGAALIALFGSFQDEIPPAPAVPRGGGGIAPGSGVGPSAGPSPGIGAAGVASLAVAPPGELSGGGSEPGVTPQPSDTVPGSLAAPEALSQVRAGCWRKAGAAAIDVALLSVATAWLLPGGFILWVGYFAAMWAWKSTTIGGLVLGLRVVRLDGRAMDVPTAVVRALGGALGVIVCFLGVLWCAWDPEKQGWHDKMAGTVVIRTSVAQALI